MKQENESSLVALDFYQIKTLSLHDARVVSWKLDLEDRALEIVLSMAYFCSKEYARQGILSIKNFDRVDVIRLIFGKKSQLS